MNDSNRTVRFKIYVVKTYDMLLLLGKPCSYSLRSCIVPYLKSGSLW